MFDEIIKNPIALAISVVLHVVLFGLLIFSFDFQTPMPKPEKVEVVQATMVDESKIQEEMRKLQQAEDLKKKRELDQKRKLEEEKRKAQELEKKRKAEEKRLKELEAKRKQEQKEAKKAEEQRKKAEAEHKKIVEKQRQEALAKRREEEDKRRSEEARRQAEAEKLQLEAARKRAAAEQKRLADEAAEQQRLADARARVVQDAIEKATGLIRSKVGNHWIKPSNFPVGQKCVVRVQLIPGGEVAAVDADCGGNEVFETSVEHAVRSASPLPIPRDISMFEHFKRIKFDFYNPEEK